MATWTEITQLIIEAIEAGDTEMQETCRKALLGDKEAQKICDQVIKDAQAMGEKG